MSKIIFTSVSKMYMPHEFTKGVTITRKGFVLSHIVIDVFAAAAAVAE